MHLPETAYIYIYQTNIFMTMHYKLKGRQK